MGRRFQDQALLATATALQDLTDYHLKDPIRFKTIFKFFTCFENFYL